MFDLKEIDAELRAKLARLEIQADPVLPSTRGGDIFLVGDESLPGKMSNGEVLHLGGGAYRVACMCAYEKGQGSSCFLEWLGRAGGQDFTEESPGKRKAFVAWCAARGIQGFCAPEVQVRMLDGAVYIYGGVDVFNKLEDGEVVEIGGASYIVVERYFTSHRTGCRGVALFEEKTH